MYVFYKEYELNSFMYCCMDVFNCLQKGQDPLVDKIPLKLDIVIYFSVENLSFTQYKRCSLLKNDTDFGKCTCILPTLRHVKK